MKKIDAKNRKQKKPAKKVSAKAPKQRVRSTRKNEPPSPAHALAKQIVKILEEKKGVDPVIVDVRGDSNVTDYFVIVSGHNAPHIGAMSDEVQIRLKELGTQCYRKSEQAESGWMVLDYVDVVTHILLVESRKYYAIEDLWAAHPRQE
ncbi:MAG: ribosome silencing factor [bacterium]